MLRCALQHDTALCLLLAGFAAACGTKASIGSGGPALVHAKPENGGATVGNSAAAIPVPPEDGPKLAPTAMVVPILAAPAKGSPTIGYLRLGARVARSKDPVGREGCQDGW